MGFGMRGGVGAYVSRGWGVVPATTLRRRECRLVKARRARVRLMCGCTLAWRRIVTIVVGRIGAVT